MMNDGDGNKLGQVNLKRKYVEKTGPVENNVTDITRQLAELSEQAGVPAVNLDEVQIQLTILEMLPREISEQHVILPFSLSGDNLKLAMLSPDDKKVIDEIEFVSGKKVFPHIALEEQLRHLIEHCYNEREGGVAVYTGVNFEKAQSRPKPAPRPPAQEASASQAATVLGKSAQSALPGSDLSLDIEIDVPLDQQLSSLAPAAPVASAEPELEVQKKILVVDDEDDIRLLISRVLTEKGYDVVTAGRGLEAIQMVQNEEPDMIILDAMLPEVHGFDICKKIKGSKKYGHVPVIMISAIYRGWRYAQDLKDSYGVDDFIEKPFKLAEFIEKVEKHLARDTRAHSEAHEDLTRKTETILTQSIQAYKAGKIDNAIDLLKKGLEIDPLAYKLHYNLALLLGKKSLHYQAIRELESTLELEPDYFPAMKNLALLYQKAGFKFKAIETWERSLHYCPDEETRTSIKQHLMEIL